LPSKSISGGGIASSDTSKIFCGAVDLKNDTGVQSNFTLSKPAAINAEDIRSYVIEWYGIMTSTLNDYYVLQMKPYNSGSSVMNGTFYGSGFRYSDGGSGAYSTNFSTYLNLCYLGGEQWYGSSGTNRSYTGASQYTPSWNGVAVYENNREHASLNYTAYMRKGSGNSAVRQEWWSGGAKNNDTTSNYADSFYFEPRTGTWTEGVVSLYAITK
jgi:hypothetical protein